MTGIELIAQERKRQIKQEGFTLERDRAYGSLELRLAAFCYLRNSAFQLGKSEVQPGVYWPWEIEWWKPSDDPVRNLVKAGALIAAEIDRLKGGT